MEYLMLIIICLSPLVLPAYIIIYLLLNRRNPGKYPIVRPTTEYARTSYSPFFREQILGKADKTAKLLAFIATRDKNMATETLASVSFSTFFKVKGAWIGRDYAPVKALMMDDIFNEHSLLVNRMIEKNEKNLLDSLMIEQIDIVNVRYTNKINLREFTALITARAINYIVDDRSGKFIIGDNESALFQEFWTFQWQTSGWLLRNIEQPNESSYLIKENLFEQYTDHQVAKVYAGPVDILGAAGALLPESIEKMETDTERLLNFLVISDESWSLQAMVDRASLAVTSIHICIESGKLNADTRCYLFPEIIETLTEQLNENNAAGYSIQYHYFCVRGVKIINVQNYDDPNKDEFTVRITFQAKNTLRKNNKLVKEDRGVSVYIEYWTFGRLDHQWKIKRALPVNLSLDGLRNMDEGSSECLMNWYYSKKRA